MVSVPPDHSTVDGAINTALHIHHHVHGPKGDYIGLGAAAFASWAAIPGAGEAALIAAGILAARGKLDISAAVVIAWAGATLGGTAGWLVGLKAGRVALTKPGRTYRFRMSTLARGDRFYERFGLVAVFFTPSWVAGIHGMRSSRFIPANAVSALVWALLVGVGAYFVGAPIVDFLEDLGLVSGILFGVLVLAAVAGGVAHQRRRKKRRAANAAGGSV
jgi:membrane-associated protein